MRGYELTNYKTVPLLANIPEDQYDLIRQRVRIFGVAKGEVVFQSGEPASHMYIVYRGSMKISNTMADGKERILYIYHSGDFVGGLNVLSGDYYAYTATALTDTFVITVTKQDFKHYLLKDQNFLLMVLEMSYERIRFSESQVDILSTPNADQRVAKVLVHLAMRFGQEEENGIRLETNLSREELGSYAGLTRETMSRKIHAFEKKGYLKTFSKGDFLITDLEGLKSRAR